MWTTEKEGSYTVHNHGEQVSARCLNYQVGLHRGYQGKMPEDRLTSATLHQRERPPNREQREIFPRLTGNGLFPSHPNIVLGRKTGRTKPVNRD